MVKLALLLFLSSCTLFDDDPPTNTCKTDQDCFRAQGETCDLDRHVCQVSPHDGGVDGP